VLFGTVGTFHQDFSQVGDDEVLEIMSKHAMMMIFCYYIQNG
jgi:predicted phosphoribosyltransferase